MKRALLVAAAVTATLIPVAPVAAQAAPADDTPTDAAVVPVAAVIGPSMQPVAEPEGAGDYKSPRIALATSLVPTATGAALITLGLVMDPSAQSNHGAPLLFAQGAIAVGIVALAVGPSLGHRYVGNAWTTGMKLRLISYAVGAVAPFVGIWECETFQGPCNPNTAYSIAGAAAALFVTSAIVDIATAPSAARARNREHHLDATLTLAPIQTATATAPSLALVGRF
jgi:hypothetical protein